MRSMFLRYSLIAVLLILTACSHVEYAANKSRYQISTSSSPVSTNNIVKQKFKDDDALLPERPKVTRVLAVTKKDPKSIANVYLQNSFSSTKNDLVFEIRREGSGYKAVTPLMFNSEKFNSNFSLSVNSRTALRAGVEFKIPLGLSK